jgi:uncharacterized protein (TIGR00255 family)
MTGFGEASATSERLKIAVTMRSVNHRGLEVTVRLREDLRSLEPAVRQIVAQRLDRGKVDVTVVAQRLTQQPVRVALRQEVITEIVDALERLPASVSREIAAGDLLNLPGVVTIEPLDANLNEEDESELLAVVERAVANLVAAREREGSTTLEALRSGLALLRARVEQLADRRVDVVSALRSGLEERLRELLDGAVDSARLAQEVALLVERSDIREELERLEAHIDHFAEVLDQSGAVGKRLDFLAQELLRELNTLGAKCRDAACSHASIDAKVLCEQLREQIQNVE